MNRKRTRWSAEEDLHLYLIARRLCDDFIRHDKGVTTESTAAQNVFSEFNKKCSGREISAVLQRLSDMKFLKRLSPPMLIREGEAKYIYNPESNILEHCGVRTPTYQKYFAPTVDQFDKLKEFILNNAKEKLSEFSPDDKLACSNMVKELNSLLVKRIKELLPSVGNIEKKRLTKILKYTNNLSITFFLLDSGMCIKGTKGDLRTNELSFTDYVLAKEDKPTQKKLNEMRHSISHSHYAITSKPPFKPCFITCSIGTGIGKSYGSLDIYVKRINEIYPERLEVNQIGIGGFTNHIFITPQKAQINCDPDLLNKLSTKGVQLLSVLSKDDLTSLDYVDWLTGEKNCDKYARWFGHKDKGPFKNTSAKTAYNELKTSLESLEKTLETADQEEIYRVKQRLLYSKNQFLNKLESLCLDAFKGDLEPLDVIKAGYRVLFEHDEFHSQGIKDKLLTKERSDLAYFELLKLVAPFEVAKYIPCFMAMTTAKSMKNARTLSRKREGGYKSESKPIDALVGGKKVGNPIYTKDKETGQRVPLLVSPILHLKDDEKCRFLKEEYFKPTSDCPYRKKNINFSIVIDELHVAYSSMLDNTIKTLINEKVHTLHIYTWASDLIKHAENCHEAGYTLENVTDSRDSWERIEQCLKFERELDDYLANKCRFSNHINGRTLLHSFNDLRGNFEVDGSEAESISRITRNVFSFHARLFANEEDLKRIRAKKDIVASSYRLYFEKEGDTQDLNPTLHDLFQLMLAIVAASTKIKSPEYMKWLQKGDHTADGKMNEFTNFIRQVSSISEDIQYMLDQPLSSDNVKVDHLYAHFQPKLVFSLSPIKRFETELTKSRADIINLSFTMDLVKASPEVSFLKMLAFTSNQLLPLSATSGYHGLYDGNYSVKFMKKMCYLLDIDFRIRDEKGLAEVEALTTARKELRKIEFHEFPEDSFSPTSKVSKDHIRVFDALKERIFLYFDKDGSHFRKDSSVFKKRELYRQLNMVLHCCKTKENALILSISHDFIKCISQAVKREPTLMYNHFGFRSLYKVEDNPKVIEIKPFKEGSTVNLILYDAALVKALDSDPNHHLEEFTTLTNYSKNVVLCSSFKSAGTGLNNVVTYAPVDDYVKRILKVKEDYQNILITGSPYYSKVNEGETLDTLSNYQIILKHVADTPKLSMKVSEIYPSLSYGDGRMIIDNEHLTAIEKMIIQCLGRGERCDTPITTNIYIPSDVVEASSFFFAKLKEKRTTNGTLNKDHSQYRSMSVITQSYADYSVSTSEKKSFENDEVRARFENEIRNMSLSITEDHNSEIKSAIRTFQKTGADEQLEFCELMRSERAFTKPKEWMKDVQIKAEKAGAHAVARTANKMFFTPNYLPEGVCLAYANLDDFFNLTDLKHGMKRYSPWLSIFPNDAFLDKKKVKAEPLVAKTLSTVEKLKAQAIASGFTPIPAMIPLLRGNVGEIIVDEVLKNLNRIPLSASEVIEKLSPKVYERFDFFVEIDDCLVCIDAKWWSKESLDITRVDKINRYLDLKKDGVLETAKGKYQTVSFIYLNAYHGDTMFKERQIANSEVHYLSLFTLANYMKEHQQKVNEKEEKSKWIKYQTREKELRVNPKFKSLLGL